jgi:hypothetical protein
MENRNGLIVGAVTTTASGHAERAAALALIEPHAMSPQPVTLGADKSPSPRRRGAMTAPISWRCRTRRLPRMSRRTPAAAARRSMIASPVYAISQRIRKRVEEAFGWAKTVAGLRKMRHRGLLKVDWQFTLAMAAYNLVRLPKLLAEVAP